MGQINDSGLFDKAGRGFLRNIFLDDPQITLQGARLVYVLNSLNLLKSLKFFF